MPAPIFGKGKPKRNLPETFAKDKDTASFMEEILGWRGNLVRTGQVIFWPTGPAIPDGTVALSAFPLKRLQYAALYAVYGTTFGPGDGSTTFDGPTVTAPVGTTALVQI
jgi:hypothetical protein